MVGFNSEKSKFSMKNYNYRTYRTSDGYDSNIENSIEIYEYLIEYREDMEQKLFQIKFTSQAGYLISEWVNHHFGLEQIKSLNSHVVSKFDFMTKQADKNILENCQRLKKSLQENTFFGINVLYFDNSQKQFNAYIQVLDFSEYEGDKLIYRKGGVTSNNEVPIKISGYRNFMEWNPLDRTLKLSNLGIKQGQKYAGVAKVVFNLNYSEESPSLELEQKPDKKTLDRWREYIKCIVDDTNISQKILEVIESKSL